VYVAHIVHATQPGTLRTADRALQVLQELASASEALTVTDIAARLGTHRSNASRLVATLEARGFVERPPTGDVLRLGPELARLGRVALAGRDLVRVAGPAMDALAAQTGETVTVAVPAGTEALTVAQSDGRHFVASGNWVGLHLPPHCCSDGQVLMAFGALPPPAGRLKRFASRTVTRRAALDRTLARVRRDGYAVVHSEFEDGLAGVSVPVRRDGACVAALCVSGPIYRLQGHAVGAAVRAGRSSAAVIERHLGAA
jgi:IclR family transcriptional regulator, acetate operon repressor